MTWVEKLVLTITKQTTTAVKFFIEYSVEGPAHDWIQVWFRTQPKDQPWIDFEGWNDHQSANIPEGGVFNHLLSLDRATHAGFKLQLMAIGANDAISNMAEIPELQPEPQAPDQDDTQAFECPYCHQRFATLDALNAHLEAVHGQQAGEIELAGEVSKIAEAVGYNAQVTAVAARVGTDAWKIQMDINSKDNVPYIASFPQIGKTPAEIYAKTTIDATAANVKYATMVTAATIAEALPMVDVGMATLQYMSAPQWAAGNQMARDYYYASYRYISDPMIRRHLFRLHTPVLPEPYRLAIAASRNILPDAEYKLAMKENGYNETWADMWRMQSYEHPNFAMITQLHWRGLLDEPMYDMLMHLAGYHPAMVDTMFELTKVIPPLSDLINMAVREAFGDHSYEQQMPALVEWGGKQGLSPEWVQKYWYAHWDRIPLTQMYSNLWRGYWDKDEFDRMLRIKDVHPDDREAIYKVAFLPPSIREMGYGYDFGRYNREDIVRYRQWGGLTPDDAEKAADALIDYRTSAEWEAIRREMLWLFAHEELTEEVFREHLEMTGLQSNVVDLWIYRGLIQQERYKIPDMAVEYRIITSSEALWAFKNGLKDEAFLRRALYDLTWSDERVNLAVERATYEKAMKEDIPDIIKNKTLTITQLRSLYNAQLISIELLTQRLQDELYYTKEDALMLAKTFMEPPKEPEPEPEPRKLTLAILKQMYEAGLIDKNQLIVELVDSLNYDINDATVLAELYTPKFEPIPEVPEEQVVYRKPYSDSWSRRLYSQRLFVPEQVYYNYIALGYDATQANKLTVSAMIDDIYPMITAQYSKGLINEEQFMQELILVGMSPTEALELLKRTIRDYQVDRLDDERKLTKSEIIKGFKNNILTIDQTIELLTDIGYEYWEANYIVNLEIVVAAGDPETFWDMKKVTESYKKALNRDNKTIPAEVLMLDKKIKQLKQEIQELTETGATASKIAEKRVELGETEARLRKVMVLKGL